MHGSQAGAPNWTGRTSASGARWQAAACPVATAIRSGYRVRHAGTANGQRGAEWQPGFWNTSCACCRNRRNASPDSAPSPFDAINPRFSIRRTIAEPLVNIGAPKAEHEARVAEAIRLVHLGDPAQWLDKRPAELSGGQLQRVVLARALMVRPSFLVADEPVSMLDVSVRAGILNLMRELRDRLRLTALYISHDMTLVRYVCERTLVMYLGKIVEDGPTDRVVAQPAHPYTQALIAAVPRPHAGQSRGALPIGSGFANPANPPSGCRLRDRCPHAFARCTAELPLLREVAPGHRVACHLHA